MPPLGKKYENAVFAVFYRGWGGGGDGRGYHLKYFKKFQVSKHINLERLSSSCPV